MRLNLAFPIAVALSTTALALAGCHGSSECTDPNTPGCLVASAQERITDPAVSDPDLAAAVAGNTAFGVDLYKRLRSEPGNLFYSPFSISEALAMTWAGAGGEVEKQMASTLHFTLGQAGQHPAFNKLDLAFASRGEDSEGQDGEPFALNIANALWGPLGSSFEPKFLDTLAVNYGAGMHILDFGDASGSAKIINEWVAGHTGDKIQDLISPEAISDETRLVLTNAIYFNARWATPFDAQYTQAADFTRADGSKVSVQTMYATVGAGYGEGQGYKVLSLPYDGNELSMVVVLPEQGTLDAFEAGLTPEKLASMTGGLGSQDVAVSMPRFKIESSFSLEEKLKALGMPAAFEGDGFTNIIAGHALHIGAVLHKAFINVNESGTEAAAATAVTMNDGAGPGVEIQLDHPFLFFIRDDATDSVLFFGRVADPS